mgnify:CR=1 FL=1
MATYGGRFTLTRFRERVLHGVQLNPEATVAERIYWAEDESVARLHLKSVR